MKLLLYLLAFFSIPVIAGLVSSYRAGVLPYQLRRAEARRRTLDLIKQGHIKPTKPIMRHGKTTTWAAPKQISTYMNENYKAIVVITITICFMFVFWSVL